MHLLCLSILVYVGLHVGSWSPHDIMERMRPLVHSCASKVLDEAGGVVPRSWSMVPAVTVNIHGASLKGPRWLGGQ
jgi:hypothetical protein